MLTRNSGDTILIKGKWDFKAILQAKAVFPLSGSPSSSIERREVFSENLNYLFKEIYKLIYK